MAGSKQDHMRDEGFTTSVMRDSRNRRITEAGVALSSQLSVSILLLEGLLVWYGIRNRTMRTGWALLAICL